MSNNAQRKPAYDNILFRAEERYETFRPFSIPQLKTHGFLFSLLMWKGTPYSVVLLNLWAILDKWQAIIAIPMSILSIVTIIIHLKHYNRRENERSKMRRLRIEEKEKEINSMP